MRKLIIVFTIILAFALSACTNAEKTPEITSGNASPDSTATIDIANDKTSYDATAKDTSTVHKVSTYYNGTCVSSDAGYIEMPFEEVLFSADIVARARCIEKVADEYHKGFIFEITKDFYGAEGLTEIFGHITNSVLELDESRYEIGKEYYLFIADSRSPYTPRDEYTVFEPYLPVEDITKSEFHGRPLLENAYLKELTTADAFEDYLTGMVNDPRFRTEPYLSRVYLPDTGMENVIANSPFVLKVTVGEEKARIVEDRIEYYCTVTEQICSDGDDVQAGETIDIVFTNDTVRTGDEIIVALSEAKDSDPRLFTLTSRASVFTADRYDEIKAIAESAKD